MISGICYTDIRINYNRTLQMKKRNCDCFWERFVSCSSFVSGNRGIGLQERYRKIHWISIFRLDFPPAFTTMILRCVSVQMNGCPRKCYRYAIRLTEASRRQIRKFTHLRFSFRVMSCLLLRLQLQSTMKIMKSWGTLQGNLCFDPR